jgi:hypothetical protein
LSLVQRAYEDLNEKQGFHRARGRSETGKELMPVIAVEVA